MSEQSDFWKGSFGDSYNKRNKGLVHSNAMFFYDTVAMGSVFSQTMSILELGCGTGMNLRALEIGKGLKYMEYGNFTHWLRGVDINAQAVDEVNNNPSSRIKAYNEDILTFDPSEYGLPAHDLVFTKGVAIHIHPNNINRLYDQLYNLSSRYILMAEYYSPRREMIEYRGHQNKLWKANFYDEMMERYPDLLLLDYGFVGHWDNAPQDDLTWWLWGK